MPDGKPRVEPRTKALIKARLRGSGPERDACILDLSTRGLLATMAKPPVRGDFIELVVGGHSIVGHVKWASSRRFGVALHERISVAALVAGDTGSIKLAMSRGAQKRGGSWLDALRQNVGQLGNFAQYAIMAAALGGAALILSDLAGDNLGSLQTAKAAMASSKR